MVTTPQQRSDENWVADLSSGDGLRDAALCELRAILVVGLRRAFRQYGPDSPLVEDAAQEALFRITERITTFRGDSRFVTWAMAIATRVALSELRRSRWSDTSLDQMVQAGKLPAGALETRSTQSGYDRGQLLNVVRDAVQNELTDRQRDVIQAELSGAPPEEIARRLNTNRNAIYKVVHDARARLKQAIHQAGWSEDHVRMIMRESDADA